jgi:endoglycosylceramidase
LPGGDPSAGLAFHVYPLTPNEAPAAIQNAIAWSTSTGGALLNTEWGATDVSQTLTQESVDLDEALVPWLFWSFSSELVPSLTEPPGGANLVPAAASILVQPYPLAVAGTPQTLSIDPTADTLTFTWSTTPAGGAPLATGTVTSIVAPPSAFPSGYTATVTNGWVTSAPCAPILTVAAMPDAGATMTVTVALQPGGTCP